MRVRYSDLSCYGSDLSRTPNLNLMVATGMRYRLLCCVTCLSSIKSSLETGCYPGRVGLDSGDDFVVLLPSDSVGLSSKETTIASMLKFIGYGTKMIGKWHLGDQPDFFPPDTASIATSVCLTAMIWHPIYPLICLLDGGTFHLCLIQDEDVIQLDPNQV